MHTLGRYTWETKILVIAGGSYDSEICSFIYLIHFLDLGGTVRRVALIDAKLIYPEIPVVEMLRNSDGIFDRPRQIMRQTTTIGNIDWGALVLIAPHICGFICVVSIRPISTSRLEYTYS
jgi:hypothetical protein